MSQRNFTRAEIAAYVEDLLTRPRVKDTRYEIQRISYLSELPIPLWVVACSSFFGKKSESRFMLYVVENSRTSAGLGLSEVCILPEGATTVAEEDAELARLEQARLEELERELGDDQTSDTAK